MGIFILAFFSILIVLVDDFFRGDRKARINCDCQNLPHDIAAPHTHDSTDYPSEHIKVHEQYHLLDKDKAPKAVRLTWI